MMRMTLTTLFFLPCWAFRTDGSSTAVVGGSAGSAALLRSTSKSPMTYRKQSFLQSKGRLLIVLSILSYLISCTWPPRSSQYHPFPKRPLTNMQASDTNDLDELRLLPSMNTSAWGSLCCLAFELTLPTPWPGQHRTAWVLHQATSIKGRSHSFDGRVDRQLAPPALQSDHCPMAHDWDWSKALSSLPANFKPKKSTKATQVFLKVSDVCSKYVSESNAESNPI